MPTETRHRHEDLRPVAAAERAVSASGRTIRRSRSSTSSARPSTASTRSTSDLEPHGHAPRRAAPLRDQRHDHRRDPGRVAVRARRRSSICRDEMDELGIYTPKMIEDRVEVQKRRPAVPAHRLAQARAVRRRRPTRRSTSTAIPARIPTWCRGCSKKEIHIWGVDCVSTDHPMNLPIGRFLGKGMHGHCDRVRKQAEEKFGGPKAVDKLFPGLGLPADAQRALPEELHAHREPRRRHRRAGAAEQAADPRLLPVEVQGRRGGVLPRGGVHRRVEAVSGRCADRSATEICARLIARARRSSGRAKSSRRASSASSAERRPQRRSSR